MTTVGDSLHPPLAPKLPWHDQHPVVACFVILIVAALLFALILILGHIGGPDGPCACSPRRLSSNA